MRWLVALVVVGCGSQPAAVDVRNTPDPDVAEMPTAPRLEATAARPELDFSHVLPDFHDELRWPLSSMSHPELAPQFDVARVFALPGVGWLELCERGVHNRVMAGRERDQLDYLRGWCSAVSGDVDAACSKLSGLTSSAVSGLAPAVRVDLANILADHGDAEKAEHWLTKHRIHDSAVLDILAATYIEVGTERDARVINRRAIDNDDYATPATKCRRLVRAIKLGSSDARLADMKELERLATGKVPDVTCLRLHRAAECLLDNRNCRGYFLDNNIPTGYVDLIFLYQRWPRGYLSHYAWMTLAGQARDLIPHVGADRLMIAALQAALRAAGRCDATLLAQLQQAEDVSDKLLPARPAELALLRESCATPAK